MDVDDFVTANEPAAGGAAFQLEHSKLLDVAVDGSVTAKSGSMVAYTGDLTFRGVSSAEGGLTGLIKEKATGEGTPVMRVEGQGHLYLADDAKDVQVLSLGSGESISVNGDDVLAFADPVSYEISTIDSLAGSSSGGLTNVFLEGPGNVAITTHGDPLVLRPPVRTDPDATVAWSGVSPGSRVDTGLSEIIGSSSGEAYQLEFEGDDGFVVVQPFEERTGT
ncbi:MAG: hypothetical protein A07HB70_02016 [uncultured archaeon A07HB70]|jgi:Uncharacterized conserved protein|nr:MAG: hypothetical protein A07HB70_02016 [uncultured archaeon A07HB70]